MFASTNASWVVCKSYKILLKRNQNPNTRNSQFIKKISWCRLIRWPTMASTTKYVICKHNKGHKWARLLYLSLCSLLGPPSCLVCSPRFLFATGRSLEPNWCSRHKRSTSKKQINKQHLQQICKNCAYWSSVSGELIRNSTTKICQLH